MLDLKPSEQIPVDPDFEQRYEAEGVLGAGGVGEVALYRDRWLGREVAVKSLRVSDWDSTGSSVARFVREARIQGQLAHPSVVPVYDFGLRADGREYIAMQRIRGATLAEVLSGEKAPSIADTQRHTGMSRRRLLEAFTRLCLAVDYAHTHGVIHRDLKPNNIMLGDFGEVYVLDWGVAKVLDQKEDGIPSSRGSRDAVGATEAGTWLGTAGYMAPEQYATDQIGPFSDVYALGAILFEILTGEPLHQGKLRSDLIRSTIEGVEARPSQRAPNLDIPPEFDPILHKATEKDPIQRYPSARSLCEAVERVLDGDRDLALRRSLAEQHTKEAHRALASAETDRELSEDLQATALRHVGRALALDPKNSEAIGVLGRVLLCEPAVVPHEVSTSMDESAGFLRRGVGRIMFFRTLSWTIFIPLTAWMGYSSPLFAVLAGSSVLLAVLLFGLLRCRSHLSTRVVGLALAVTSLVTLGMSGMFGSFIIVPAIAVTNIIFFILHSPVSHRWWITLVGVLTVVGPFLASLLGWIPSAYTLSNNHILIEPRVINYPPTMTNYVLLFAHVALIVTPALIIMRVRDALLAAERKNFLHTWRISQLVRLGDYAEVTARPKRH